MLHPLEAAGVIGSIAAVVWLGYALAYALQDYISVSWSIVTYVVATIYLSLSYEVWQHVEITVAIVCIVIVGALLLDYLFIDQTWRDR